MTSFRQLGQVRLVAKADAEDRVLGPECSVCLPDIDTLVEHPLFVETQEPRVLAVRSITTEKQQYPARHNGPKNQRGHYVYERTAPHRQADQRCCSNQKSHV